MKNQLIAMLLLLSILLAGCEYGIVFETAPTAEPTAPPATAVSETAPAEEDVLIVHFLDVGQADCTLIEYGDYFALIDGGNREDSRLVVSYLEAQGVTELDTLVCTHAHEDHVGGLPGVLAVYPTHQVLAPTKTYASNIFDHFLYYTDQQGLEVTIPQPGDTFGTGELVITVLGPVTSYADPNDTSIVLRLTFGDTSFLFTGDMELEAENGMLDYWGEAWEGVDVLKVGHHGSETSTGYRLLYQTNPDYAVISVGTDNTYGHPHETILSRLHDAGCTVFRTDEMGVITALSDGKEVTLTWEKQDALPANGIPADHRLIGNTNSGLFHTALCTYLPGESNRIYFDTYDEAVDQGYTPCNRCLY